MGGLWVGDFDKLIYFDTRGGVAEYGIRDGYPKNAMARQFWKDADGSLWFATGRFQISGVGLVRFKDGKFEVFGAAEGLSDNHIFNIFKDREGTIWLATDRGLNRLRRQIITSLSKADGLADNEVYPILKARDGSVYIGTARGLSRYKNGELSRINLSFADSLKFEPSIQSLWEDADGRLWVGGLGALFIIENGKARRLDGLFDGIRTVSAILSERRFLKRKMENYGSEHTEEFRWRNAEGRIRVAGLKAIRPKTVWRAIPCVRSMKIRRAYFGSEHTTAVYRVFRKKKICLNRKSQF